MSAPRPRIRVFLRIFKWHLLAILILLIARSYADEAPANPAVTDIQATIKKMQVSADRCKATNVPAYLMYTDAIKDLSKYVTESDEQTKLLPQLLTKATLHKLFKGKSQFDVKSGKLALMYDFSDAACLQDFRVDGSLPDIVKDAVVVPIAQSITHKVVWDGQVTITGEIKCGNRSGDHVTFTNGWAISENSYNAWFANLRGPGLSVAQARVNGDYGHTEDTTWMPFTITIMPKSVSIAWDTAKLGSPVTSKFSGGMTLQGSSGGDSYRNLTLVGVPDREWLQAEVNKL